MRALLIAIVLALVCASTVQAQTGTPTSWTLRIYQSGAPTALNAVTVSAPVVQCNQPAPTGSTQNPTKWFWNDVVNAGKVCIFDDTARLAAVPDGTYEGTASASNADGSSAETARIPFSRRRPNPPAVPTGLSFTP